MPERAIAVAHSVGGVKTEPGRASMAEQVEWLTGYRKRAAVDASFHSAVALKTTSPLLARLLEACGYPAAVE